MTPPSITWTASRENLDDVFKVFLELLHEPGFREDKLPWPKTS